MALNLLKRNNLARLLPGHPNNVEADSRPHNLADVAHVLAIHRIFKRLVFPPARNHPQIASANTAATIRHLASQRLKIRPLHQRLANAIYLRPPLRLNGLIRIRRHTHQNMGNNAPLGLGELLQMAVVILTRRFLGHRRLRRVNFILIDLVLENIQTQIVLQLLQSDIRLRQQHHQRPPLTQRLLQLLLGHLNIRLRNQNIRALHFRLYQLTHHQVVHRLLQNPQLKLCQLLGRKARRGLGRQTNHLLLNLSRGDAHLIHPNSHFRLLNARRLHNFRLPLATPQQPASQNPNHQPLYHSRHNDHPFQ